MNEVRISPRDAAKRVESHLKPLIEVSKHPPHLWRVALTLINGNEDDRRGPRSTAARSAEPCISCGLLWIYRK